MSERETPEYGNNKKQEDYFFMKETIKKKPLNVGFYVKRAFAVMLGGALFGGSAAVAFTLACPAAAEKFIAGEAVALSDARPGPVNISAAQVSENSGEPQGIATDGNADFSGEAADMVSGDGDRQNASWLSSESSMDASELQDISDSDESAAGHSIDTYASIYQDAVQIAEKPMKAMVRISGLSGDSDLLDDSFLTYGDEEGVVFYNSESEVYILTNYKGLEKSEIIRVTFSNGAVANGILCKSDPRTGLAVVRVPLNLLTEEEWDEIYVASLSDSFNLNNEKTVIAIGSPSGDFGSVIYGLVTSVSGRMTVADCEYSLLGTNIMGSSESSGVMLDMNGDVIGMIVRTEEDENILKGVSIAEIRPLIESLSNGEQIRYLGIIGATISEIQAQNLEIPVGIYVDFVEPDSPAMVAGIQNGDIITGMNGEELADMQSYMNRLQNLTVGADAVLTVCRKGSEGKFVEMEFDLTIEEK